MAIRIRRVRNLLVALCAAETDPQRGDLYLSDGVHYALAAKFARDWQHVTINWSYPDEWAAMASQKKRDASEELRKWHKAGFNPFQGMAVHLSEFRPMGLVSPTPELRVLPGLPDNASTL